MRPLPALALAVPALLVPAAAAQEATAPAPDPAPARAPREASGEAPADGWRTADEVVAQAGDEVVTLSQVERFLDRRSVEAGIVIAPSERPGYLRQALGPTILQELEIQAGLDMGLDRERIQRIVDLTLEGRRAELGPNEYRTFLADEGIDARDVGRVREDELYAHAWRTRQVGYENASGERPVHDRYVRPGELRAIYSVNKARYADPDEVVFQALMVAADAMGDAERTLATMKNIRQRALGGEPFDHLVEEYGQYRREALGVTDAFEVDRIRDPGAREFAEEAEVGQLSEVMPVVQDGETRAFQLLLLKERHEGGPTREFGDPDVQRDMRLQYQRQREQALLGRARERLRRSAYVWRAPGWEEPEGEGGDAGAGAEGSSGDAGGEPSRAP